MALPEVASVGVLEVAEELAVVAVAQRAAAVAAEATEVVPERMELEAKY